MDRLKDLRAIEHIGTIYGEIRGLVKKYIGSFLSMSSPGWLQKWTSHLWIKFQKQYLIVHPHLNVLPTWTHWGGSAKTIRVSCWCNEPSGARCTCDLLRHLFNPVLHTHCPGEEQRDQSQGRGNFSSNQNRKIGRRDQ